MTNEEKKLLERLAAGDFEGLVGSVFETGESTVWTEIRNGKPARFKRGPGGKYFNGKENERFEGKLTLLREWVTDEEKIQFFRDFGFLVKDAAAKAYSAKFKK